MCKYNYFLLIIIATLRTTYSQSSFSESFLNITNSSQVHFPSLVCLNNKIESSTTYRTYTGKLSIINNAYFDFNTNINLLKNSKSLKKNIIGFAILNEKEGNYFNRIRVMGKYSLHIALRNETYLAAGVSLHLINYNFQSQNNGATGSDFSWAGTTSLSIYGKSYKVGFSYNDFNKPVLQPIDYEFTLNNFLATYGEKSINLSSNTQLKSAIRLNFLPNNKLNSIIHTGFIFSDIVGVNAFLFLNKGHGFTIDLKKINFYKTKFDFSVTYFVPKAFIGASANQFELNLKLNLPKN